MPPGVEDNIQTDLLSLENHSSPENQPATTSPNDNQENDNSSSEDSNAEEEAPQVKASHRKKLQKARFEELLSKRADTGPIHKAKAAAAPDLPDAQLSTANLIAKKDQGAGVLDPREYQIELFERAKSQNTIAVLDTGSGKTLIAVLLLKHILQNELINRAHGQPHRVAFFLVDRVTLSFQQTSVLRNNLDQNVGHFYGAMGTDFWDKETWNEQFKNNMVIVCTAEILSQCLLSAFITMAQINLLVFDEAHHTKKDHAYARIIRDSYLRAPVSHRPRIFGMTASPIDTKGDILKEALKLEALLDSKIATTSNLTLLRQVVSRPVEIVWEYDKLEAPFATNLHRIMETRFGDIKDLETVFRFSLSASSELGPWCSDKAWLRALSDEVLPKLEGKANKLNLLGGLDEDAKSASKTCIRIREASDLVRNFPFHSIQEPGQLSSKVQVLRRELGTLFARPTNTKCIVFTQRRHTARMLLEAFTEFNTPYLRPGVLMGIRADDLIGTKITFHQQFLTLVKFRNGEINCLFATSVAEEGLDIPDCNLVVRFDLYDTLIQYVQSRGRARHSDSTYVSMIEKYNFNQEARLLEVRDAERAMRRFCETLPEDRILHGNDDLGSLLQGHKSQRTFIAKSTGATLNYYNAITILARYASSLQYEGDLMTHVTYVVLPVNNTYVCEVILPEKSPVRGFTGAPATKKSVAKQSAAFDTCLLLRKHQLLDDHLNSIYHRRLPAMRNAKLAITSKRTNEYGMRLKPEFWSQQRDTTPEKLTALLICFKPSGKLSREHRSIFLLVRARLPNFPSFSIFLDDDIETTVHSVQLDKDLLASTDEIELLTSFTLRVFQDVFNKTYAREPEKLPYWLAPAKALSNIEEGCDPRNIIDWDTVVSVHETEEVPFTPGAAPETLVDRFVFDYWDGRYRYFTIAVDDKLTPSSPPPSFVPRRRCMENIMDWSCTLSKNSKAKFFPRCDWSQPVLRAELVHIRRNVLDKMTDQEREVETRCFICLEPLKVSAIPATIAASFIAFPAIISRFDSTMIALECCKKLDLVIEPAYALEACTKDSDNTEEHRMQQIHAQRGMGKNYERLEFLGDCFLKMATSIALFAQNPDDDEYDFHVNRMCLICNKNLFKSAIKLKIFEYIRSRGFSRHTWYPDGLTLLRGKDHTKKSSAEAKHALAEKTIADVCEALIGASLLSGGPSHRFDMAVKAVSALVESTTHSVSSWGEYKELYSIPSYQSRQADGAEADLCRIIEAKMGYRFKYPRLLCSAFTHPSWPSAWSKQVPCYQRLEFLGDSLLDMACVEYLFDKYPDRDPQWLTEHKMAMVSNKFLGALAVKLGFHKHLKHFSNVMHSQINTYVEEIQAAEVESEDAVDYWLATKDSPKCLPDMVEAYLGAIFIDSDFNFEVIEAFFQEHVKPFFRDMAIYDTFANKHPTTFLHNKLAHEYGCTNYCVKAGEIPAADGGPAGILAAVIVHDTVLAEGTASSSRYAKIKASEEALVVLEGINPWEFREKYHCDCGQTVGEQNGDIGTAV